MTAISTTSLVVGVPLVLVVLWLLLVLIGFQGPFVLLVHAFALPPVGTLADTSVVTSLFPGWPGLIAMMVTIVFRATLIASMAGAATQVLTRGRVDRWIWAPALRALPASLAVSFASLSLLFAAQLIGAFLGGAGGLGLLVLIGVFVLGVSYFGYAPAIAASEDRRVVDSVQRAWRVARIPGSGNLSLATLYVVPSFALFLSVPALPGGAFGVNPSVGAWILVLSVNLLHAAVAAAYAYRYLSIADAVPEATPQPSRSRR